MFFGSISWVHKGGSSLNLLIKDSLHEVVKVPDCCTTLIFISTLILILCLSADYHLTLFTSDTVTYQKPLRTGRIIYSWKIS